jgi:hypothetical protein
VRAARFELARIRGLGPARLPVPPRPRLGASDRLERSPPKPAVFEAAASTDSAKRAVVRAEGFEPPRCYPSHSECSASSCSATRAWCCGIAKSSAETRALEPERPTGRRGALCTRAPSWTSHRSILADRNSCRPKNGQLTAHRGPLAGGQRQARRPCGHASVSSFAGDLADHLALRFLRRPMVSAVTLVLR